MIELIDTHSHLTFDKLIDDIDGVLNRAEQAGITKMITVGTDSEHNEKAVELAERYENIYAAVGIHPHDAQHVTCQIIEELRQLARNLKVVAIGETGLDFHYNFSKQPDQRRIFEAHLHIAKEMNLPVIIHSREAFEDTIEILEKFIRLNGNLKKVVFHCFGGTFEQARIILDHNFYISFTGVVTFKNAESIRQAARIVPIERMMLETDCPYMSPEPVRKQKINEPALMIHTAKFLADLKNMELEEFAAGVTQTSKSFFDLP